MTFVGRKRVAPDYPYAPYDETGTGETRDSEGNLRWKYKADGTQAIIVMLTELVADSSRPAEERDRAAEVLQFYAEYVKYSVDHPPEVGDIENNITAARMMGGMYAGHLWFDPDDALTRTEVAADGSSYRYVVSKKFHGPRTVSDDIPASAKTQPVRQPEPVIEPAPVVEQNRPLSFDERFSPAEVQRRVDRIIAEANAQHERK